MIAQNLELNAKLDSIVTLRKLSKDSGLQLELRLDYAKRASQLSLETKIDSTILRSNRDLSFIYLIMGNYDSTKLVSYSNLKLANKLNDSIAKAEANHFIGFSHHSEVQHDSAYYYYYKAVKQYNMLNKVQQEGELLYSMANIQNIEKDYIGAEVNAVRAISLVQTLQETESNSDLLWSLYNLLGIISEKLQQYDKAIEYHNKALTFSDKISDNHLYNLYSNTNLGSVYREKGNYKKSIEYFKMILDYKTLL